LVDSIESHPHFENLSQQLIALEKTCVNRKPIRPVVRRNRRVLGDIQNPQDIIHTDTSEELLIKLRSLQCGPKI
jgi:hypothetical protein